MFTRTLSHVTLAQAVAYVVRAQGDTPEARDLADYAAAALDAERYDREAEQAAKEVATWSLAECSEYVEDMRESNDIQRAEAGMGAVSMGFDPYDGMAEWAAAQEPDHYYNAAMARLAAESPAPAVPAATYAPDPADIPF